MQEAESGSIERKCGPPRAGSFGFDCIPYGQEYILRTGMAPRPGTQVALPPAAANISVASGQLELVVSNFTAAASRAVGYAATPVLLPLPGSTIQLTLLVQDTEVGNGNEQNRKPIGSPATEKDQCLLLCYGRFLSLVQP